MFEAVFETFNSDPDVKDVTGSIFINSGFGDGSEDSFGTFYIEKNNREIDFKEKNNKNDFLIHLYRTSFETIGGMIDVLDFSFSAVKARHLSL